VYYLEMLVHLLGSDIRFERTLTQEANSIVQEVVGLLEAEVFPDELLYGHLAPPLSTGTT
jgi:hypothetical protein